MELELYNILAGGAYSNWWKMVPKKW